LDAEPPSETPASWHLIYFDLPQGLYTLILCFFFVLAAVVFFSASFHFWNDSECDSTHTNPIFSRIGRQLSSMPKAYSLVARACLLFTYFQVFDVLFYNQENTIPQINGASQDSLDYSQLLRGLFLFVIVFVFESILPAKQWIVSRLFCSKWRVLLDLVAFPFLPFVLLASWVSNKNKVLQTEAAMEDSAALQRTISGQHTWEEVSYTEGKSNGTVPDFAHFREITARQIMCPRMDIFAVADHWPFSQVLTYVKETGYSRLPVYHGDVDSITGILYVKDILPFVENKDNIDWLPLIREGVLFVPESVKIDMLLKEFQLRRQHMAIIVDEYGGTSGIATLEDILEELVGEIKDEFDAEDEQVFHKISERQYIFDGKTLLQDVCRITGVSSGYFDPFRNEADSLGGLILEQSGNIPLEGKVFQVGNISLNVMHVNKNRIERIGFEIKENEAM
jgi:CBS domain containing-hemolysin-like protein